METNERKWKIILPAKDPESTCKYILNKRPYLWSHDFYYWNERLVLQGSMTFCEDVYGSWSQTCSCIQSPLTPLSRHNVCLWQVIRFKSPFYLLKTGNDYGSWHMGLLWLWSETDTKVNRFSGWNNTLETPSSLFSSCEKRKEFWDERWLQTHSCYASHNGFWTLRMFLPHRIGTNLHVKGN